MSHFVILLRFTDRRHLAPNALSSHNDWLRQGFDDGIFLLAGSLPDKAGGLLVAACTTSEALRQRIDGDPFVVQGIVAAEIIPFRPHRAASGLEFLIEEAR